MNRRAIDDLYHERVEVATNRLKNNLLRIASCDAYDIYNREIQDAHEGTAIRLAELRGEL